MISLKLTRPPSANRLWRFSARGVHRSAEYKTWMAAAQWEIMAQAKKKKIVGPFKLTMMVQRPDKRRRDLDNLIKPVLDALKKGLVIEDDRDCEWIDVWWADIEPDVIVELHEVEDGQAK